MELTRLANAPKVIETPDEVTSPSHKIAKSSTLQLVISRQTTGETGET